MWADKSWIYPRKHPWSGHERVGTEDKNWDSQITKFCLWLHSYGDSYLWYRDAYCVVIQSQDSRNPIPFCFNSYSWKRNIKYSHGHYELTILCTSSNFREGEFGDRPVCNKRAAHYSKLNRHSQAKNIYHCNNITIIYWFIHFKQKMKLL